MRVIDEVHLEMPYAGARKLRVELRERTGGEINVTRRCLSGLIKRHATRALHDELRILLLIELHMMLSPLVS